MLNGWINDNLAGGHAVCFDEDDGDSDMFNISSSTWIRIGWMAISSGRRRSIQKQACK